MGHTKGPWELGKYLTRSYWRSVWGPDHTMVCEVCGTGREIKESEANLGLILAAPDMLEVLYEVEFNGPNDANPICPSCYGWNKHESNCKLDAAIKKAEGE